MRTLAIASLVVASAAITAAAAGGVPAARNAPKACPMPDSGTCLGKLAGGTYTSQSFRPKFSFRVSAGWSNYLDISGLYLLQPPGANPPGDSIAGSFIGLETSVAPEGFDCRSRVPGVQTTPAAIAAWMSRQRGLAISRRHTVALGGLHGVALDVRMARGARGCLSAGATAPGVPLLVGIGPSSFDHEVAPGIAERHYLLAYKGGTLDVQIIDASGGRHAAIAGTFRFRR